MTGKTSREAGAMSEEAVEEAAVPRGAVGEGAGEPAGSWSGREAELDTLQQLPLGKEPAEQGELQPGLATALPSQLVFPSKQGKAAGEEGSCA